ncbi:hypothetical protein BRC90_07220 [Halobacteriales archaeon QS_4_69_34]|nr:MAG: hypothetical protein BRC90_07220 [Halobacteriales archaeon QS_4_69_34]
MQRRAAAVYAVFFLVLAVGAYAALSVAQEPAVSVEGESLSPGQNVTFGDQTYTVGNISGGSGGGEGGEGGGEGGGSGPTSELTRVNESARFTTTLENNSTLVFREGTYRSAGEGEGDSGGGGSSGTADNGTGASGTTNGTTTSGGNATGTAAANANASANGTSTNGTSTNGSAARTFRVLVPNATGASAAGGSGETGESNNTTTAGSGNTSGSGNASGGSGGTNVTTVTLRGEFNASVLARQDPAVEDSILTAPNGTRYVRYASNGTTRPVEEYLPEPEVRNVSVGDSFPYKNNSTTVETIEAGSVTLAWTGPEEITEELEEGTNVTLGGQELVAHFPDNETLVLSRNVATYQEEVRAVEDYNERLAGFWGIIIISGLTVILLVGMAYLPVRG